MVAMFLKGSQQLYDFVNKNENQGVVFSRIRFFYDNEAGERVLTDQYMPSDSAIKYYGMSAEAQYHRILSCCFTPSNSVFLKRSLAVEYPFPEQYPYNEDDPHWHIDATRTWLLPGGELAMFNALLYVGYVPVLYLPAFYYPKDELVFNPVLDMAEM